MHFCIKLTYRIWQYPNALDACTTAYKVFSFDVIVLRLHIHRTCLMTMVIIIIKEKQWFRKKNMRMRRMVPNEKWCYLPFCWKCIYFLGKFGLNWCIRNWSTICCSTHFSGNYFKRDIHFTYDSEANSGDRHQIESDYFYWSTENKSRIRTHSAD